MIERRLHPWHALPVAALFWLFAAGVHAQTPQMINFQGRLLNGTNLVNANVAMKLNLYLGEVAVVPIYQDTGVVTVVDGLYSTYLGDQTTLGNLADAVTNTTLYIEVVVNSTTLTPRERIASVAYALIANSVTTGAISTAMLADSAVTSGKILDATIVNADIAPGAAIADTKLATIATAGKVSDSALSANVSKLGSSIDSAEIANGTIAPADVNASAFGATFWKADGNTGTTPGSHFLGTTDGAALKISAGGGVGIGTDTPDDAVDVEGASPHLRISNSDETEGGLRFVDVDQPDAQFARIDFDASSTTNQNLNFYVNSANAPVMTIRGNRSVGIGTTTPSDGILDVEGDTRINSYNIFLRGGTDRSHGLGWYGSGSLFGGVNVDGPVLYGYGGGGLGHVVAGLPTTNLVLRWTSGGRVGIGDDNPDEKLVVSGAIRIGSNTDASPAAGTIRWTGLAFEGFNGVEWVTFGTALTAPVGMALIPAGSFSMGDPYNEGYGYERPVHAIQISAFYMDKFEVTNRKMREVLQWAFENGLVTAFAATVQNNEGDVQELIDLAYSELSFSGGSFSIDAGREDFPCIGVSWYGAMAYCNYRSDREGLARAVNFTNWSIDMSKTGYRLPTEAEWEKAARGGLAGHHYPWSSLGGAYGAHIDGSRANYSSSGDPYSGNPIASTPVGYYDGGQTPAGVDMANGYGLYDVAGNVWEWCFDWYGEAWYSDTAAVDVDTHGPASGTYRVVRGGSWQNNILYGNTFTQRCSWRGTLPPDFPTLGTGLRCARGL